MAWMGSKRDCSTGVFLFSPVPGAVMCFNPALGDRTDKQSRGRLMQMLTSIPYIWQRTEEEGEYFRVGVGEKSVCVGSVAEVVF